MAPQSRFLNLFDEKYPSASRNPPASSSGQPQAWYQSREYDGESYHQQSYNTQDEPARPMYADQPDYYEQQGFEQQFHRPESIDSFSYKCYVNEQDPAQFPSQQAHYSAHYPGMKSSPKPQYSPWNQGGSSRPSELKFNPFDHSSTHSQAWYQQSDPQYNRPLPGFTGSSARGKAPAGYPTAGVHQTRKPDSGYTSSDDQSGSADQGLLARIEFLEAKVESMRSELSPLTERYSNDGIWKGDMEKQINDIKDNEAAHRNTLYSRVTGLQNDYKRTGEMGQRLVQLMNQNRQDAGQQILDVEAGFYRNLREMQIYTHNNFSVQEQAIEAIHERVDQVVQVVHAQTTKNAEFEADVMHIVGADDDRKLAMEKDLSEIHEMLEVQKTSTRSQVDVIGGVQDRLEEVANILDAVKNLQTQVADLSDILQSRNETILGLQKQVTELSAVPKSAGALKTRVEEQNKTIGSLLQQIATLSSVLQSVSEEAPGSYSATFESQTAQLKVPDEAQDIAEVYSKAQQKMHLLVMIIMFIMILPEPIVALLLVVACAIYGGLLGASQPHVIVDAADKDNDDDDSGADRSSSKPDSEDLNTSQKQSDSGNEKSRDTSESNEDENQDRVAPSRDGRDELQDELVTVEEVSSPLKHSTYSEEQRVDPGSWLSHGGFSLPYPPPLVPTDASSDNCPSDMSAEGASLGGCWDLVLYKSADNVHVSGAVGSLPNISSQDIKDAGELLMDRGKKPLGLGNRENAPKDLQVLRSVVGAEQAGRPIVPVRGRLDHRPSPGSLIASPLPTALGWNIKVVGPFEPAEEHVGDLSQALIVRPPTDPIVLKLSDTDAIYLSDDEDDDEESDPRERRLLLGLDPPGTSVGIGKASPEASFLEELRCRPPWEVETGIYHRDKHPMTDELFSGDETTTTAIDNATTAVRNDGKIGEISTETFTDFSVKEEDHIIGHEELDGNAPFNSVVEQSQTAVMAGADAGEGATSARTQLVERAHSSAYRVQSNEETVLYPSVKVSESIEASNEKHFKPEWLGGTAAAQSPKSGKRCAQKKSKRGRRRRN